MRLKLSSSRIFATLPLTFTEPLIEPRTYTITSSLGYIKAAISPDDTLTSLRVIDQPMTNSSRNMPLIIRNLKKQMDDYLSGRLKVFHVPVRYTGTPFQLKVWDALLNIPYGQTASYQSIATLINSPRACRAVGTAVSNNPIFLIIPCHRVIQKNGSIGGFAYGAHLKKILLNLEKNNP